METTLISYGITNAAEFLDDRIVYRDLQPIQPDLPSLADCMTRLDLPPGRVPRKHEVDYARVVAHILGVAQHLRLPAHSLRSLVYIGDTELLDITAFANLCQVTGWRGFAFIGDETIDPPEIRLQTSPVGELYLSNRWCALEEFDQYCARLGFPVDSQTAVVIDLDKTILGARRRNSQTIDRARTTAMQQTLAQILGSAFDPAQFNLVYQTFNRVEYHPFTSDNQDYLAYVCLMLIGNVVSISDLQRALSEQQLCTFDQFIRQIEQRKTSLPAHLAETHAQVYASVLAGDPTPFKAFRRFEYVVTVKAMGGLPSDAPVSALLAEEITLTQEVRQIALEWRNRGALTFGLSDKPNEASLPTPELAAQGFMPLHRAPTHAVGRL